MNNYSFRKNSLDEINEDFMLEMALITMGAGINSIAPLGFSGDSYYLFGELKNYLWGKRYDR